MNNTITLDFGNLENELKNKNLKLCFIKTNMNNIYVEDAKGILYQIELYRIGSYLDRLKEDKTKVIFEQIDKSNIKEYQQSYYNMSGGIENEKWKITN